MEETKLGPLDWTPMEPATRHAQRASQLLSGVEDAGERVELRAEFEAAVCVASQHTGVVGSEWFGVEFLRDLIRGVWD